MRSSEAKLEIEVKLPARTPEEARERLARLPAQLEEERHFEENEVFDTPERRLAASGSLLRLRIVEGRGLVTFKEKVESRLRAKVRSEVESQVGSPDAVRAILGKLGLARVYRYQKYRSYHAWRDPETSSTLCISLDETPIGVFIELEGDKGAIDAAARRMGYDEADFVLEDYRALHHAWLRRRGLPAADMVFEASPPSGDDAQAEAR